MIKPQLREKPIEILNNGMMSFNEYFLNLMEQSGLFSVPRKIMGVHTDPKYIPSDAPYGFWVDKSGNFIPTNSHIDTAVDILKNANDYLEAKGGERIKFNPRSWSDGYRILYDNGWIRVLSQAMDKIYYETKTGGQATQSQLKFLNHIKDLYNKSGVEQDVVSNYGGVDDLTV